MASELSPVISDDRNDDRKDDKKNGKDKDRDTDKGHNDDRDRDNDDHGDRDRDRDGHHDDDHDDDDALRPILECVVRHSHNSYTAYFGYKNETNKTIAVPVGSKNSFSPSPQNRNQPTVFPKGRSPHYPNAAFSVPFNGSSLTWSLRGPNSDTKAVTARSSSNRCEATPNPTPTPTPTATPTPIPTPTPPATCANPVLTERRYTRTSGICNGHGHGRHDRDDDDNGPTVYSQTFILPAGSVGPYTLRVVNGDALGRNRTSSAEVKINGALVVGPSDFSQNVTTFTKTIASLQANNQIYVKVSGAPGSTFTIGICGADPGDTVPPSVNWISPLEGELSSDPSPLLRVRYTDLVSNPNPATLKILIDGVDRTTLFNRQPDEASLDGLVTLPDGTHTLRAEIQDQAGNLGAATRTFRTDATPPNLLIAAPPSGAMSSEARPQIRLTFADAGTEPAGVIPTSLAVSLDGVDITAALTRTATEAVGLPPTALTSGPHQLAATIADVAGNTTTVTSGFHVDTVPPVVTTVSPTANQVLGSATVAVAVSYSDNHELNLESFRATIDGVAVPIVVDADSASGSMSGLVDGPHLLTLSIADRAGNVRTTTTAFSTDTGGPQIAVVTPPNGVLLNLLNPELLVTFEDGQGLDLSSLRIRVNGADRTADFTRTTTEARATLADALPEGVNTIAVEIRDQASNLGAASSSFTLDVTAPTVTVRAPIANAFLNDATPDVQIDLADSLTGVEPTATRIFVDDIDVTADFSIGPTLAAGTLSNALSEGPHTLRVVTADRAANPTVVEVVFVIDLTAPTLDMASPREGSFTNDSTPEIWLRTADPIPGSGIGPAAGVSSASIRVFLLSTDPAVPDTDLTPLLTIDASESRGEFTTALPDGTHRLRAVARDHAGNEAEITVGFVVDTTAPTVAIDQPQNGTFLPTAEPTIVLLYSDERSGIDPDLTQVKVDGIERAASLTLTATGATLTLSSVLGLSLADGPHQIEARVVDQAGNAMEAAPVTFGIDTIAPTAAITSPVHQSFVGVAQPSVAFTLQDAAPSSGINTEFIRVFLDGVDITANATLTPGGEGALTATAAVAMPLSDGLHTLRVTAIDNANQQAEAISQFTVDTTPPVVTPAGPGNGSTIGASLTNGNGTFTLTFSFVDIDPSTTATCTSGPTSVSASPQGEGHSCILPIVEGLNTFAVMVTDSTGHSSTLAKTLILDTLVPGVAISTPLAASVTSAQTLTVHGTVADATAVTVSVNGVPATVVPGFNGSPTTFEAQGVVVGPGPSATFEAVAQDLGGNTGRASVSVVVDRTLPLVTISTPASGAYLPGVPATVNVDVIDATATTLEINGVVATRGACQPAATAQEPSRQRCSYEASVPVTPGAFQIVAAARDAASNQGVAQVSVIVDATAPVLTVTAPAAGLVTSATSITVTGTVADTSPATLTTDGAPTALGAEGTFSADIPAGPEGLRTIQLLARDAAGNETARSISVIVDRTAPALTIGQPSNAARLGSSSTPVIVQFTDDQLDPATFVATLDGAAFSMTLAEGSATGLAENLAEGPHTVSARIADKAGNVTTREITFTVDTIVPSITIEQPAPSFLMPTATPFVSIVYSDAQGVDTATLRIRVDGIDVTSRSTIASGSATATLLPLGEGAHTIVAEIKDLTGNLASATASFSTDTVAPVVAIVSPPSGARLNTSTPQVTFTYQDPGGDASSGVDPPTVRVLLDGVEVTSAFVLSGGDATGTSPTPLADGSHTLRVEAKDRAANSSFAETAFLVDTQAPVATFGAPVDGSFTNDTTPDVLITFADPGASASGISPSFVRVFLTAVGAGSPEVDVTSALVVGPTTITGALPGPLAAGTYRIRVALRDEALNYSEVATTFEVDLTPPTFEIGQPAAGSAILTGSPAFVIRYADDRSGLATDRFAFRVDGVDRTARLAVGASEASGTLLAEEALADGPHSYDFTLFDRAGNRTDSGSISFVVDSAPPTAVLVEPAPQSFIGVNTPRVRFQFQDPAPSSGINPGATRIQVDGVDRTPDFTITADGAVVAAVAPALSDGLHTVRADIADRSGSAGFVVAQFTVDTAAPVLTSEIPEEGRLVGGGALVDGRATISGTATDLDPALTVTCSSPAGPGVATLSNASYSCSVPVAEGANEISVTATDTTAHSATITRTLTVDRIAPTIQITDPTEGTFTSVQSLTVTGIVSDTASITVSVNGQSAVVAPSAGGPATFEATNVPVGAGPTAAFEVVATDAAGNAATATVTVRVDRDPPVVAITQPASSDYLRGGVTTVTVDVTDDTTTILDINGIPGAQTGCVDVAQGQPGALTAEAKRCTFTADIPLIAGNTTIVATAFDAAGNRGVNQVSAIVDNTPPAISVTSPGLGLITNATSVAVVGTIADDSPLTLTVNGQAVTVALGGSFSATIANDVLGMPLSGIEGAREIVFVATDAAGNEATTSISVVFDRTPPALSIASPLQGAIIPSSSVSVSGTVADATAVTVTVEGSPATVTGQAWSTTLADLAEGSLTITVRAVDAAGNESTVVREVEVDLGPPTVVITSPAAGTLTREATALLAFSVLDRSATSITLNGAPVAPACPGVLACERTQSVDLVDGDNTFTVEATDAGGRSASAQVTITRDSNAPSVELLAPETASRGRVATASVSAVDNLALASVEVRVAGAVGSTVLCSGVAACSGPIVIPEEARPGDSLSLTATATDTAGNTTTTSRTVRVTSDGVVTGTVLNDLTSLPLAGATVTLLGPNTRSTTTNEEGRYNIPVVEISAILRIEKAGMTSVDRVVSVNTGTGTVLVDARLTPLAETTTHSPVIPATNPPAVIPSASPADVAGTPGPVSLAAEGAQRVTLLSAQGLPNLLPPGFSPLTAFSWMPENASAAARVTVALPTGTASLPETVLVRYDPAMRDWRVVAKALVAVAGVIEVDLIGSGSYALVVPDAASTVPEGVEGVPVEGTIAIGNVGEPLVGVAVTPIPATATSEGRVDPPVLPPTGGTATGLLRIDSPTPLPSGTIVQADLEETYTLASGEEASAPKRSVDVIAFKHSTLATAWGTGDNAGTITGAATSTACTPSTPPVAGSEPLEHLCAAFPITPSRTYSNASLREGRVKLDLLAGRENARGVVGGSEAMSVVAGNVQLNVAAGSLAEDTAIALWSYGDYSPFIPTTNGITPLGEVTVDFASSTLNTTAALTFRNVAAAPGDTLVVARVDRAAYDGIPRLQVVALADVISANEETNAVTRVDTGLAGLTLEGVKKEGRYTLLRLAGPIGWITGATLASGSPVRALVTTDTLPFVATSNTSGAYAIPAVPGPVTLTARVLGQSLIGGAQTTAVEGAPAAVNLLLEGAVSQATITPASGAIGVEVNDLLTLTSPVALDPTTVVPANISLRRVPPQGCAEPDPPASLNCAATQIPLRLVLSGSGKQLSIIPTRAVPEPVVGLPVEGSALAFSTTYALEITGLLDTVGGLVTAPTTTFRTKDDIKPVYNLKALTFSFPDADGLVTVSAPAGTFPPGTEILIINSGNGVVLGLTAGNDGEVNGTLPAGLSDILMVTVTDPFGNTASFESSRFVNPATGETAIGPGGGVIEGPQGTAMTIPEGALSEGVAFKLDVLTPEQYDTLFPDQRPAFGTRPIGTVLKISAAQEGTFHRPVKLTFNVPSNFATTHPGADPRDAVFYALKRSILPSGVVAYEAVDHAFAVCPGDAPGGDLPARDDPANPTCDASELRVKTASPPHSELTGLILADMYILLTYDWSSAGARTALAGTVVGRVRRKAWGSGDQAGQIRYEPIRGALVFGSDSDGNPLQSGNVVFTTSQGDGTYTLWDSAYEGGAVTVHAFKDGNTATGTGYEGNPQDTSASWGPFQALRFYQNKAHVDVVFEAQAPPPLDPDVAIIVMRDEDRVDTRGLSQVGTALRIGFRNNRPNEEVTIGALDINGDSFTVIGDSSGRFTRITQDAWTPSQAGTYVLQTTALSPTAGSIPVSTTVRILAAGGGVDNDPNQAPRVIDQQTYPKRGAKNISIAAFPSVAFTEPVIGISYSNVLLTRTDLLTGQTSSEAFKISGVTATGQVVPDVTTSPTLPITAITLLPIAGLKYKHRYTLSLTNGIVDLDAPPKSLVAYSTTFETFGPEPISPENQPESYTTTGFYVAKDAEGEPLSMWSLKHGFSGPLWLSLLTGYDLENPVEVAANSSTSFIGRPMDLVGEGTIMAMATAPGVRSIPSNVRLFDVSNAAAPVEIGAASIAVNVGQGTANRITLRGNRIYAGTMKRGIQIIDTDQMRADYKPCTSQVCDVSYFNMQRDLSTDGVGFATSAAFKTFPVAGANAGFSGIKSIQQSDEPLIVAVGSFGLALAKENASALLHQGYPVKGADRLNYAYAVDVAKVGGYDIALMAGLAGDRQILMAVDVTNPLLPTVRGVLEIQTGGRGVVDILIQGTVAYVSTQKITTPASLAVEVFDLSGIDTIAHLGTIEGVGGRLAISGKLLYGAASTTFGNAIDGLGGVRTAALGTMALIDATNPPVVVVGEGPRAAEDFRMRYRVIPGNVEVESAQIEYRHADATVGAPVSVTLNPEGRGELPLSLGFTFPTVGEALARPRLTIRTTEGEEVIGPLRSWRLEQPEVRLSYGTPAAPDEKLDGLDGVVRADFPQVSAYAASAEWSARSQEDEAAGRPPVTRGVTFEALAAPATLVGAVDLSSTGIFKTTLDAWTESGATRRVRARLGDVVLGETQDIEVEPGAPSQIAIAMTHVRPGPVAGALPADGKSEMLISIEVRDAFGNLVDDGTPVAWEKGEGADGELVEPLTVTSGGRSSTKYRVGFEPGTATLKVHVGEATESAAIQQALIGLTMAAPTIRSYHNRTPLFLQAMLTSSAGPLAPDTEVSWFASGGRMIASSGDGTTANAEWKFDAMTYRERVDFWVLVGAARAQQRMLWTLDAVASAAPTIGTRVASVAPTTKVFAQGPTSPPPVLSVFPEVIAADIAGDSIVPLERADGTFEQVPVKGSARFRLLGLTQGERVSARLGAPSAPNLPPIAHYSGDGREQSTVADLTGAHEAQLGGGVMVLSEDYNGPAFQFSGTGGVSIPHHAEFAFSSGFMVQAAIRPPPAGTAIGSTAGGTGVLIEKAGGFRLEVVEVSGELRPRFTVFTAQGSEFITGSMPLRRAEWSLVSAQYDGGRIFVGQGDALESQFISSAPVVATTLSPIEIGIGLTGSLDEIRIFDLAKSPFSAFEDGAQAIDIVADATGTYETSIVASGVLAQPRVARYMSQYLGTRVAGGSEAAVLSAIAVMGAEATQADLSDRITGVFFARAEVHYADRAETATTNIGYVSATLMAATTRFVKGLVSGSGSSGDGLDFATFAGDMVGTFNPFTGPYALVRNAANAADKLVRGVANAGDGIDIALAITSASVSLLGGPGKALGVVPKILKGVGKLSPAARTVARLGLQEARVAAGASGLSRISKLLQIAQVSNAATVLVVTLLQSIGQDPESVGHLNNILTVAENPPNRPFDVIEALVEISQQLDPADFRQLLAAFGQPDIGSPAADVPLGLRLARVSAKAIRAAARAILSAKVPAQPRGRAGTVLYRAFIAMKKTGLPEETINKTFQQIDDILANRGGVSGFKERLEQLAMANRSRAMTIMKQIDDGHSLLQKNPGHLAFEVRIPTQNGGSYRKMDSVVLNEAGRSALRNGQDLVPENVVGITESASWPFFYAGGFPTVDHPTLIKGTSAAAKAARKEASRLWGPIDQKAEQLTDYLTEFAGQFGAKFTLSIRAPLNFNATEKDEFKRELIKYFQSRITEENALLREFLRKRKLRGNNTAYQTAVARGREALLTKVIIE